METSRSDDAGGGTMADEDDATGDSGADDLQIPETASGEEAAAIAAAIGTYLADERAPPEAAGADERSWNGRRWSFAGRLEDVTGRAARVPEGAPVDAWEAAGRADRF